MFVSWTVIMGSQEKSRKNKKSDFRVLLHSASSAVSMGSGSASRLRPCERDADLKRSDQSGGAAELAADAGEDVGDAATNASHHRCSKTRKSLFLFFLDFSW